MVAMDIEHNAQRVALVAGATRGAGRAIAVELARAGLYVYATGRSSRAAGRSEIGRPETIEDTGDRIGATGGRGTALVVDHEDPAAVAGLVARIESEHGRHRAGPDLAALLHQLAPAPDGAHRVADPLLELARLLDRMVRLPRRPS